MITPASPYYAQVRLLVRVLPVVAKETCFALKGGTALNLFVRDMPRLSVDIDLAYVPLDERAVALDQIDAALGRIGVELAGQRYGYRVRPGKRQEGRICGLLVGDTTGDIKIEVAPVLRGCVYPETSRTITARAEAEFGFAEMPVLSFEDLYAGKIMAALDRQHPRDLFDVKLLLAAEGLTERLIQAFLIYLISHDGSLARIIRPNLKPLDELYRRQFSGMTMEPVALDELEQARIALIDGLHRRLGDAEKSFLLSFKQGKPRWELLAVEHAAALPAVRWKLMNIAAMSAEQHRHAVTNLERILEQI